MVIEGCCVTENKKNETHTDITLSLMLLHSKKSKQLPDVFRDYEQEAPDFQYSHLTDNLIEDILSQLQEVESDSKANKIIRQRDNRRKIANILYVMQFDDYTNSVIRPLRILSSVADIKYNNENRIAYHTVRLNKEIRDDVTRIALIDIINDFIFDDKANKTDKKLEDEQEQYIKYCNQYFVYADEMIDFGTENNMEEADDFEEDQDDLNDKKEDALAYSLADDLLDEPEEEKKELDTYFHVVLNDYQLFSDMDILQKEAKYIIADIKEKGFFEKNHGFYDYMRTPRISGFINTILEDTAGYIFAEKKRFAVIADVYGIRDSTNIIEEYPFRNDVVEPRALYKKRSDEIQTLNKIEVEIDEALGIKQEDPPESYFDWVVSFTLAMQQDLKEMQAIFKKVRSERVESTLYVDNGLDRVLDDCLSSIDSAKEGDEYFDEEFIEVHELVRIINTNIHCLSPFDDEGEVLSRAEEFFENLKEAMDTHKKPYDPEIFEEARLILGYLRVHQRERLLKKLNIKPQEKSPN